MKAKITLRCLKQADFAAVDKLREVAGWNQTLTDWRRLLALDPQGCFVAIDEGRIVGSATTTLFGTELAWIGMMLVDPAARNRGIGRQLLVHCLEYLQGKGVRCIKLDATPAGQILYEKLEFKIEWLLARWMKTAGDRSEIPAPNRDVVVASNGDWSQIAELDREALGVERPHFLRSLGKDSAHAVICRGLAGDLEGYGFLREGVNADYIGPLVAKTESAGKNIALQLLRATSRPIFWDIPMPCEKAADWATRLGFVHQRPLLRMYRGENENTGEPHKIWGISDPATG